MLSLAVLSIITNITGYNVRLTLAVRRAQLKKTTIKYELSSKAQRKIHIQNAHRLYKTKMLTSFLNDIKYLDYISYTFIKIFVQFSLSRTVCEKKNA